MCRSARIHGRSARGTAPRAARPLASAERAVELVELAGDDREALALRGSPPLCLQALAQRVVLREPRDRGGGELGLLEDPGRVGERCPGRGGLEPEPHGARRSGRDDRGLGEHGGARGRRPAGANANTVAERERDPGPSRQRLRPQQHRLPVGQLAQRPERGAGDGERPGVELDHDQATLRTRGVQVRVDSRRDHAVVAGEALGSRLGRSRRGREQRVDATQQLLAQGPSRRIAEPLGREEGGDAESLRVAEREVRDARQAGLETVDDVEPALAQREVEVRAHADGHAEARAARDRDGRTDRDHLGGFAAGERAVPCDEVGGPARRREHRDGVPEPAQLLRDPRDVLVDVVRL